MARVCVTIEKYHLWIECPICGIAVCPDLILHQQQRKLFSAFMDRRTEYSAYLTHEQAKRAYGRNYRDQTVPKMMRDLRLEHRLPLRLEREKAGWRIRFTDSKEVSHD